jgi:hypothetical protein
LHNIIICFRFLIAEQREHEERKIVYYGNLLAKVIEFVRRQLKVALKQGNNVGPQLIVTSVSTIWSGLNSFPKEKQFPTVFRYVLRRDENIELELQSEFLLRVGVVDAYLYAQNGDRIQIHRGGSKLDCQNVPPGESNLQIDTECEPRNDGMAKFVDRVQLC